MRTSSLKAQEPSWDSSQKWMESYDRGLLDKLKVAPSSRPSRTTNTTLRPLRPSMDAGADGQAAAGSFSQAPSPSTDRNDFGPLPLLCSRASPAPALSSTEDGYVRSGVTPDSAVSVMSSVRSGVSGRAFLSPRAPPRQTSSGGGGGGGGGGAAAAAAAAAVAAAPR